MRYRTLGRSGAAVSTQALGTMTFGAEADETTSGEILGAFVERGGTLVDTADVYSSGVSEEIIGRWLAKHPTEAAQVVIATKGRFPMGEGPNDLGLSRRHLRRALDDSLRRLDVDHIDLYQMHAWDGLTPLEETLRFLDDAVSAGKIGLLRVLQLPGLAAHEGRARRRGPRLGTPGHPATAVQLLVRDIEHEVVPAALDAGVVCCRGRRWPAAGSRASTSARRRSDGSDSPRGQPGAGDGGMGGPQRRRTHLARRGRRARRGSCSGVTASQVALAWLSAQPAVTSVIWVSAP